MLVLCPSFARAQRPPVEGARRAYDELRYGDVLNEVAAARRGGQLSRQEDVELTRLEAYTYAVFEDEAHAIEAFRRLLALEPDFVPDHASPKIRAYFEKARRRSRSRTTALTLSPPPGEEADRSSILRSRWLWGGAAA